MYLLAGDIGGTKSLMALAKIMDGELVTQFEASLPSAEYDTIETMLQDFMDQSQARPQDIVATTLALAGPVQRSGNRSRCQLTNLPWYADSEALSHWTGGAPTELINDFAAIGYALEHLQKDDLVVLQQGRPEPRAPRLAMGAGTGLGLCMADGQGIQTRIYPSESGHVHFSPADEEQLALMHYWLKSQGHCSREFLLSGPGIQHIAGYLQTERDIQPGPALSQAMQRDDASAALSQAALAGSDELGVETLRLFTRIYAAQLGDAALGYLPYGGLYIAGGIATKILPLLERPEFMQAFRDNPAMRALLEDIPVSVITSGRAGLIGALNRARAILTRTRSNTGD